MKKSYQSHIYKTRDEFVMEFQKENISKDRFYMAEMIKPIILFLDHFGICNYQNFYQLLHSYNFKSNDINEMIEEFRDYINTYKVNCQIEWIKKRELKKSNYGEKNIILNRLAIEYPNEIIDFILYFASKKLKNCSNIEILVNEFRSKINTLKNQVQIDSFLKSFK